MAIFGTIGGSIGLVSGSVGGIIKGKKYNTERKLNTNFHLQKDWIGYEVWILSIAFGGNYNYNKYFRNTMPGGCITFRLNRYNLKFLDEIRVGFIPGLRWRNMDYNSLTELTDLDADEMRWSTEFLKHFTQCKGYIIPYTGLGCGGAKLLIKQRYENQRDKMESVFVPLIDIITGVEFNAFDFLFIRSEISYEIYGPYYRLKKIAGISPLLNLRFSLRTGCLLF
jgi:hypothetical protein